MQGGIGYPLAPQRGGPRAVRARGVSETSLHGGLQPRCFPKKLRAPETFAGLRGLHLGCIPPCKAEPATPWCRAGVARGWYGPGGYPKRPCMGVCNLDVFQKSRGPLKISRACVDFIWAVNPHARRIRLPPGATAGRPEGGTGQGGIRNVLAWGFATYDVSTR